MQNCQKKTTKSDSDEHPTDLVSACLDNAAPLIKSVSCDINSSEDSESFKKLSPEEQSKRILEIYKERFRVRRIRPDSMHSATMYGKIMKSKTSSRRLRFIADSGTGIPIVPVEIANEHDIEVFEVDPDEPGCYGASGHDLEIIGQCHMNVKIEGMKKVKRMHCLVANQCDDEI